MYHYLTDFLLTAKCFFRLEKFVLALEYLDKVWPIAEHYLSKNDFEIKEDYYEKIGEIEIFSQNFEKVFEHEETTQISKKNILEGFIKRGHLISVFSGLYYNL